MRQEPIDPLQIIKYVYSLENVSIPETVKTKAIIFYTYEEDADILKNNNIFYLGEDCSKEDIHNVITEKLKTEDFIGLHSSDFKLAILFSVYNIPCINILTTLTKKALFEVGGLRVSGDNMLGEDDLEKLKDMYLIKLSQNKCLRIHDNIVIAKVEKDFIIDDNSIKDILNTKYNMYNVFEEESKTLEGIINKYARSQH